MSGLLPVHHLAVVVRDLERSRAFYGDVLKLPELRRHFDAQGRLRSIWLSLGGQAFLALERAVSEGPGRRDEAAGWHCVALGIAAQDREDWRLRLEGAACPIERESRHTLYVRDPDGNLLGLSHYPEEPR